MSAALEQHGRRILTLMLVVRQHSGGSGVAQQVLLGMKKRGFGEGKLNGFGGKVHVGETVREGAARELLEEAGIVATEFDERGIIDFDFEDSAFSPPLRVHVFRCDSFTGEPRESDEMTVRWQDADKMPYDEMWQDDRYWLPVLLRGGRFLARFSFRTHDLLSHHIQEVAELDASLMPSAEAAGAALS